MRIALHKVKLQWITSWTFASTAILFMVGNTMSRKHRWHWSHPMPSACVVALLFTLPAGAPP
eukprot:3770320-Amphidinium_carterae.1